MTGRHGRVGAQREATLDRGHYVGEANFTPEHLHSMSFQVLQLHALRPRRVLEVGVGNGFVSTFLRQSGIEVVTADVNPGLGADICAPLDQLPALLVGERFDVVSCCEVLEHIPFEQFGAQLDALRTLAPQAFLSLPGHFPWLGLAGRLGVHNRFVNVALGLRIPCRRRLTDGHYWEIGSHWRTRRAALVAAMRTRWAQVDSGVFPLHRYHYWFRCAGVDGQP